MTYLLNIFILSLACMLVKCNVQKDGQLIFQNPSGDTTKIIVLVNGNEETATGCKIVTNNELINDLLKSSDSANIRTLTKQNMRKLLEVCKEFNLKRMEGNAMETIRDENDIVETQMDGPRSLISLFPDIYPGTKWCGRGNIAENYNDLGVYQDTDRCCRTHDFCNDTLAPGETKYNLTNVWDYTKLSCECDYEFYTCLKRVNSEVSASVTKIYFYWYGSECYAKDYPQECKLDLGSLEKSCLKVYQWIPLDEYIARDL